MTRSFSRLELSRPQRRSPHGHYRHHRQEDSASSNKRASEAQEAPVFDDEDASSQSPSFGSVSVSNSSMSKSRQESEFSSTFRVQLTRGPHGFGFSIAGGTDQEPPLPNIDSRFVFVARITPGGAADINGRLRYD